MRVASVALLLVAACAQPPRTEAAPAPEPEAVAPAVEAATVALPGPAALVAFREDSRFEQAGLAFGRTLPGARVVMDDVSVPVDAEGRFVLGFGQFAEAQATLRVTLPDGGEVAQALAVAPREFEFGGVIDVPASQVSQFSEADLEHIRRSTAAKTAARARPSPDDALWSVGFGWPAEGYVTSRFGKFRRYPNGDVVRPHSGVDVAAPRAPGGGPAFDYTGAEVVSPSAGVVTLAEPDMFFEGGLVLIDHGQGLESALLHLSEVDVAAGDAVARGQRIGGAGSTGRSTGPHVHWSLKWHGRLVDPEALVPPMEDAR